MMLNISVTTENNASEYIERFFLSLASNRLLMDESNKNKLPYVSITSGVVIDVEGNVEPNYQITPEYLTKTARDWLIRVESDANKILGRFVRLLRWINDTTGGHISHSAGILEWSSDEMQWFRLPSDSGITLDLVRQFSLTDGEKKNLTILLGNGTDEPVAHDLLREARHLALTAPRSAFLIGMAALETALKTTLSNSVPEAKLFIEEFQAPPVSKLLNEILPKVLKASERKITEFPLNQEASNYLKKWVSIRNQISHGRKSSVSESDVQDFLKFVHDIIYLMDTIDGNEWAKSHISTGNRLRTEES
jgi:hypothetical protein